MTRPEPAAPDILDLLRLALDGCLMAWPDLSAWLDRMERPA